MKFVHDSLTYTGTFKYYIIRLGGVGGLNQNDDNDDAFREGGGSGT